MSKTWYEIRVTCGWKPGMSSGMNDELVAKVKSDGLAQIIRLRLLEVYGKDAIIKIS